MKRTMSFIGAIALLIMFAPMPVMVRAQTGPPTEVPVLVKDIFPGSGNSIAWLGQFGIPPGPFAPVGINGILFFRANDGTSGIELWRTDGTTDGTFRVKDIVPGAGGSSPQNLVESGGLLFFKATDSSGTVRLWRSDGTEAGTFPIGNLNVSSPDGPVDVGGTVYFTASDGTTGQELWRSDGTQAGTSLVKDINAGFFGSGPSSLTSAGGMLFFVASDSTGRELWRSDGTAVGTFRVKDIFPNNNPSSVPSPDSLTPVGGLLFFRAYDGVGSLTQLWRSDGTEAGTFKINNVFMPGPGSVPCATSHPFSFEFGGTILFAGYADAATSDFELWRSDGSAGGAFRVKDINPGSNYSWPHCFVEVGGTAFFAARDGATDYELWRTDGTEAGTYQVKDGGPASPTYLTDADGVLFFSGVDLGTSELWRSDGSAAGTLRVADINPRGSSRPENLVYSGGKLYFSADDGVHGRELWVLGLNVSPSAADDSVTTNEDNAVTISVLENDADPNGDALTLSEATQGANGSVVINPDGTLTYMPAPNFFGADSFTYTINDTHGGTAMGIVNVTIDPVNDAPTAADSGVVLNEDTQIEITLPASDIDSPSVNFILASAPLAGTLSPIVNGKVTYTPDPDYSGSDCLTFIVNDGMLDSNIAAVSINVTPLPDSPVLATIGDLVITEGALLSLALSATDPDGEQLIFSASGLPDGATFNPSTGAFSWTPNNDDAGTYSISFTVTDATGRSASESITITVADVVTNLGPICSAAYPGISEIWPPNHSEVPIGIFGVTDPDNDPITISIRQILQDEPTNIFSDGNTPIDGGGVGTAQAWVRAERSGAKRAAGNGRVYEIFFEASDNRGKFCTGSVKVGVPHDQGHGPAVDDGKRYDSTVAGGPCLNCNP